MLVLLRLVLGLITSKDCNGLMGGYSSSQALHVRCGWLSLVDVAMHGDMQ